MLMILAPINKQTTLNAVSGLPGVECLTKMLPSVKMLTHKTLFWQIRENSSRKVFRPDSNWSYTIGSLILQLSSEHQSLYNSLQFFQWLVLLQCYCQNYDSSGRQTVGSETAVEYDQTWTHLTRETNPMFLYPWQCLPPEEPMILVWASTGNNTFHATITYYIHQFHAQSQYGIVTYFSLFKLRFSLRVSANTEAPESPILFPSILWKRVHVLQG